MALNEYRIGDTGQYEYDKVQAAIDRLRMSEPIALELDPEHGYYLCDSGGKDSSVIKELAKMAGVKFAIHHNHTTLDHPETVYFVRREQDRWREMGYEYEIDYPEETFWRLARRKGMLPLRQARYCCEVLKERGGQDKFCITGVRWAESVARKNNRGIAEVQGRRKGEGLILLNDNDENRKEIETCQRKGKRVVNPIIDWSNEDVWEYLKKFNVPFNPLYAIGFKRVGCMLCPFASTKEKQATLEQFPGLKLRMTHLCRGILDDRRAKGLPVLNQNTPETYLENWLKG